MLTFETLSLSDTQKSAGVLAPYLKPHHVVLLSGDLGAGKTALARALIQTLCDDDALDVPSPSFTLIQSYHGKDAVINHADLYRLERAEEIFELGLFELAQEGLLLIEWPERLGVHVKEFSKQALLRIMITTITDNKRRIRIDGFSPEIEDRITQDWRAKA